MGSHWGSIPVEPVVFSEEYGRSCDSYSARLLFSRFLEEWATSAGDEPHINQFLLMFISSLAGGLYLPTLSLDMGGLSTPRKLSLVGL